MRSDTWKMPRILLVAAAVALAPASAAPASDHTFSDAAIKRAMPRGTSPDSATEQSGKDERQPALVNEGAQGHPAPLMSDRATQRSTRHIVARAWPERDRDLFVAAGGHPFRGVGIQSKPYRRMRM